MADYLDREHEEMYCGLIQNCTLGYGIVLSANEVGRGIIEVNPTPISPEHDTKELRAFMQKTALSWLDQLETIPFRNTVNDNDPD